jgi:hypothetical protein
VRSGPPIIPHISWYTASLQMKVPQKGHTLHYSDLSETSFNLLADADFLCFLKMKRTGIISEQACRSQVVRIRKNDLL